MRYIVNKSNEKPCRLKNSTTLKELWKSQDEDIEIIESNEMYDNLEAKMLIVLEGEFEQWKKCMQMEWERQLDAYIRDMKKKDKIIMRQLRIVISQWTSH